MNIIKGLITKDLLQLKSYKKTLIMFIVIFALTSLAQENAKGIGNMLAVMITLGFGMFSITTFNYDELAKADRYILTFPLTKKDIVLSKYVLVILSTIIGAIIGTSLSFIIMFIVNKQLPYMYDVIGIGLGAILGISLIEAIQIPCIYKYGVEKGKILLFIVTAGIALLIGGIIFIGNKISMKIPMDNILNAITNFVPIIIMVAIIIIYYSSYRISYKIYNNKEI